MASYCHDRFPLCVIETWDHSNDKGIQFNQKKPTSSVKWRDPSSTWFSSNTVEFSSFPSPFSPRSAGGRSSPLSSSIAHSGGSTVPAIGIIISLNMVQGYGGNIYDIQPNNETTRVLAADFGSYFLSRWNFLVLVWSKNSSLFYMLNIFCLLFSHE